MKKIILVLACLLLIGCVSQPTQELTQPRTPTVDAAAITPEKPLAATTQPTGQPTYPDSPSGGEIAVASMGGLCSGEECTAFCNRQKGECEEYCRRNPSNQMCMERFAYVSQGPKTATPPQRRSMDSRGCEGSGAVTFTQPIRKIGDIEAISPMGLMITSHVTPIDHQYYYPPNWKPELREEDMLDVYAPADGVVTSLQRMPSFFETSKGTGLDDYRMVIHHTCTFYTIYIHLHWLPPKLEEFLEMKVPPVKLKAGELIGRATSFDFSAHNEEVTLPGFIVPQHYDGEVWKIHTVDPFDYFTPELKAQLVAKSPRSAEPLGGKIDYDVDGRLIGNWFNEDTNGYQGINQPEYWVTHASFSPDAYDPGTFIVSLGDFNGKARQFAVKGNAPNPIDIEVATGIVKYELGQIEYVDGAGMHWDRISYAKGLKGVAPTREFEGVVLVQLIEKRKLKLEAFPGKTPEQVTGFTENAAVYER